MSKTKQVYVTETPPKKDIADAVSDGVGGAIKMTEDVIDVVVNTLSGKKKN